MKTEFLLDHETILAQQAQFVHFALRFTAAKTTLQERRPAAFCVVLDRSGSMEGSPLEHAKRAAKTAITNLRKEDEFALVVFDDAANVVVPLMTSGQKQTWLESVKTIKAGGSTNLSAGWMLGRDELAKASKDYSRRLLLLSDGHLNHGIVDPVLVRGIVASGLEKNGIRTSCLGFGDGYDEDLLGSLAKTTNGEFYDADSPEKLPAIFAKELEGLQSLEVQNLRIRMQRLDFCDQIVGLNDYPFVNLPDGRVEVAVGDLVSEEERVVVFALAVPALPVVNGRPVASLEGELLLQVEIAYDEIESGGIASRTVTQLVRVRATQDPTEVKTNETVLSWVAVQRAGKVLREARLEAQQGNLTEARGHLLREIVCLDKSGSPEVVAEALGTLRQAMMMLEGEAGKRRGSKALYCMEAEAARPSSRRPRK